MEVESATSCDTSKKLTKILNIALSSLTCTNVFNDGWVVPCNWHTN